MFRLAPASGESSAKCTFKRSISTREICRLLDAYWNSGGVSMRKYASTSRPLSTAFIRFIGKRYCESVRLCKFCPSLMKWAAASSVQSSVMVECRINSSRSRMVWTASSRILGFSLPIMARYSIGTVK